jgi:hypothetical protein
MSSAVRVRFWAPAERTQLCDLLDEVGPDTPTLRPGWRTADLAAHLAVRENLTRVRRQPFSVLVDRIRKGGLLPREGRLGEALHLLEFVVHRQDVLRAGSARPPGSAHPAGSGHPADQDNDRDADPGLDAAVFEQLGRWAGLLGRRIPVGVGLLVRSYRHGSIELRRGPAVVVVDGEPVELALWLFGRGGASRVTVERHGGDAGILARVEASLRH